MAEENDGGSVLVGLLVTTLVLGVLVLMLKSDYRIDQIKSSNDDYYPNVTVSIGSD